MFSMDISAFVCLKDREIGSTLGSVETQRYLSRFLVENASCFEAVFSSFPFE
jgi:hypothetical protein